MKRVSIFTTLFFISCLFQLSWVYAQEDQIVDKNPIIVEFKLVCDRNSDECVKVIAATTGEELYVQKAAVLNLEDVSSAEVESEETPDEIADVLNKAGLKPDSKSNSLKLNLNDKGKEKLSKTTSQNIGKRIAIFIDGNLISAPNIYEPISDGELAITYSSSFDKAKLIAERINQAKELNNKKK